MAKFVKEKFNCSIQYYTPQGQLYKIAMVNVDGDNISRASDFHSPFKGDNRLFTKEWMNHLEKQLKIYKDSTFQIIADDGESYFDFVMGRFEKLQIGIQKTQPESIEQLLSKFKKVI